VAEIPVSARGWMWAVPALGLEAAAASAACSSSDSREIRRDLITGVPVRDACVKTAMSAPPKRAPSRDAAALERVPRLGAPY
jgi:hypothetical protein